MDSSLHPQHRTDQLVLSAFDGELLIQDTKQHKAHALNLQAASVFRLADGTRSIEEIALLASAELQQTMTAEMVWYSLGLLQSKGLLAERIIDKQERITRRVLLQRAGAAVALASIASIVVPAVSAHASGCRASGENCTLNTQCCPGYDCGPTDVCRACFPGNSC